MHTVTPLDFIQFLETLGKTKPGHFSHEAKMAIYYRLKLVEEFIEMFAPSNSVEVDFNYIVENWKGYPSALDAIKDIKPFNNNEPITTEEAAVEYINEHSKIVFINKKDSCDGIIILKKDFL